VGVGAVESLRAVVHFLNFSCLRNTVVLPCVACMLCWRATWVNAVALRNVGFSFKSTCLTNTAALLCVACLHALLARQVGQHCRTALCCFFFLLYLPQQHCSAALCCLLACLSGASGGSTLPRCAVLVLLYV
jgi:hypothetical protein